MHRLPGKASNRVYRLDTDKGSFAVKELDVAGRRWTSPAADVFRFERAAHAAGIPMPEPVSAGADVLVHRWVEGEPLPDGPVPAAFAFEVGEILARLHALHVDWTHETVDEPIPTDWPELADRAAAASAAGGDLPWAAALAAEVDTFVDMARFVAGCERQGPVVLTHRDVQPWNLLARAGRPVLLDWALSGRLDLAGELGATAVSLAKGATFDDVDRRAIGAVLDGYVAGGGVLPAPGPLWFVFLLEGWLGFTHRNIERCLAGVEPAAGPDLATAQDEVRHGLRGLPDLFHHLPDLERLLG
jgi:Ser/Thr protein kinase RdoA (MazF antagonist)